MSRPYKDYMRATNPKDVKYNCVTCVNPIIQDGMSIPGTDVLGYYRDCDRCRNLEYTPCKWHTSVEP